MVQLLKAELPTTARMRRGSLRSPRASCRALALHHQHTEDAIVTKEEAFRVGTTLIGLYFLVYAAQSLIIQG